ncbi:hypothetical protein COBT_001845 [Conglomerata obtusa]
MEQDFDKYDIINKGFLTYEEYRLLSLSHLTRPLSHEEIGDVIFKHDLRNHKIEKTNNEYIEIFKLLSENGYITYGSLLKMCVKIEYEIKPQQLQQIIKCVDCDEKIGYEKFTKIMTMFNL